MMHDRIREFEKQSGLEIFGLGAKRHIWEAALEKYADLVVRECMSNLHLNGYDDAMIQIKQHFEVKEPKGWICPKCGADRTKTACPLGFGATVDGRCPMTVEAQ